MSGSGWWFILSQVCIWNRRDSAILTCAFADSKADWNNSLIVRAAIASVKAPSDAAARTAN